MDAETFEADLEAEYETELSRLGSSKSMYAATAGEMDGSTVTRAMADRTAAAAATVAAWADDEPDADAAAAFEAAAGELRELTDRIADAADGYEPETTPVGAVARLHDLEGTAARVGGLLAWSLIADRTLSQAVAFFVGNADARAADRFRGIRSAVEGIHDRAGETLGAVCADEAAWGAASEAAAGTVEAAYDHYVETLEGLGIKVKPVC